jgi:hypothetical protein
MGKSYFFTCGECGHIYRNDALGKNLKSKNPARRFPAWSRTRSASKFHEFHESYCAICECCGCSPSIKEDSEVELIG